MVKLFKVGLYIWNHWKTAYEGGFMLYEVKYFTNPDAVNAYIDNYNNNPWFINVDNEHERVNQYGHLQGYTTVTEVSAYEVDGRYFTNEIGVEV